jgi:hypothetical protein
MNRAGGWYFLAQSINFSIIDSFETMHKVVNVPVFNDVSKCGKVNGVVWKLRKLRCP